MTSIAPSPSYVTLPAPVRDGIAILDFLDLRFPFVGRAVWKERLCSGKITDDDGVVISLETPYRENRRLRYFREVKGEPVIPFREIIIHQDDHILVACKPHFLPVTPSGPYVNECLLYRLRESTGNTDLVPVHRIDRETAGLVMFSADPESRKDYVRLFKTGDVFKVYEAIATLHRCRDKQEFEVMSRIVSGDRWFLSRNVEGEPNARTVVRARELQGDYARYEILPLTGKQHQIRLHMALLGCQIVNDPFYPELQPEPKVGFDKPLQLLAKKLVFTDPVTGEMREFNSSRALEWPR